MQDVLTQGLISEFHYEQNNICTSIGAWQIYQPWLTCRPTASCLRVQRLSPPSKREVFTLKFSSKTISIFTCLFQKLYLVIGKWILGKLNTYYQCHKPWTVLTLTVLFTGKQLRLILLMASSSTCPLRSGISNTSGCMLLESILTTSQSDAAGVCSSASSALAKEQIIV